MQPIDNSLYNQFPPENNPFIIQQGNPALQDPRERVRREIQTIYSSIPIQRYEEIPTRNSLNSPVSSMNHPPSTSGISQHTAQFPPYPNLTQPNEEHPSVPTNQTSLSEHKITAITKEELAEIIKDETDSLERSDTIFTVAVTVLIIASITFLIMTAVTSPVLFPLSIFTFLAATGVWVGGIFYYCENRDFSFNTKRTVESEKFYDFIQDPDKAKLLRSRHFETLVQAFCEKNNLELQYKNNESSIKELKEKNEEKIKKLIEESEKEEKELQEKLTSETAERIARLEELNHKITYDAHNPYL